MKNLSVILVAGGKGTRFGGEIPKPFIFLEGKRIIEYSLEVFSSLLFVKEIILVLDPAYSKYFSYPTALPGLRRQDSVWNGFQKIDPKTDFVCIHDSARPFITTKIVEQVFETANQVGASAPAIPMTSTMKEVDENGFIKKTYPRDFFAIIQTPQIIRYDWLKEGFEHAFQKNLTVTDDLFLIEQLNYPCRLVPGNPNNIKITTKEDFSFATHLLQQKEWLFIPTN